jgi:hypothetical protein
VAAALLVALVAGGGFAWHEHGHELSAHVSRLTGNDAKAATASRQALLHWQRDADLAAVRDRDLLAKLPEAERTAWANLWGHVDILLARHQPGR